MGEVLIYESNRNSSKNRGFKKRSCFRCIKAKSPRCPDRQRGQTYIHVFNHPAKNRLWKSFRASVGGGGCDEADRTQTCGRSDATASRPCACTKQPDCRPSAARVDTPHSRIARDFRIIFAAYWPLPLSYWLQYSTSTCVWLYEFCILCRHFLSPATASRTPSAAPPPTPPIRQTGG